MNGRAAMMLSILVLVSPDSKWIEDPSAVPLEKFEWRSGERYRILADFNADGIEDMALSSDKSMFGNAGGEFALYLRNVEGKYREHGSFFAHPMAIALETSWRGVRVWVYHHSSATSGEVGYYKILDEGVSELESITIYPGSGGTAMGNAIYEAIVRNRETPLRIEQSETNDKTVNWKELTGWGFSETKAKPSGHDSDATANFEQQNGDL